MTGRDPYCLWHQLDDHYMPVEGGGEPMPPPYPSRLYAVMCAFGMFEIKHQARMAGAKLPGDEERARVAAAREREERFEAARERREGRGG